MGDAHGTVMRRAREDTARLGADLGRVKKHARLADVVAAARERERSHPSLSLRPAAPTAGPAANNGAACAPTSGVLAL